MEDMPAHWQAAMSMYYASGRTMAEIAGTLGVHESLVSYIRRAALRRMAERLEAIGICSSGKAL
jgi:DNA-directed RNA polymerase specialized sigma subunit